MLVANCWTHGTTTSPEQGKGNARKKLVAVVKGINGKTLLEGKLLEKVSLFMREGCKQSEGKQES